MVLAILFETTSPTRSLRCARGFWIWVSDIGKWGLLGLARVAQHGELRLDARDVAAQRPQAGRLLQLRARLLQAQVENLLAQIAAQGRQLDDRRVLDFGI